jgi:opacity protein-like surface antigen
MVRFGSRVVAVLVALALGGMADARAQLYLAGNFGVDFPNDSDISSSGTGTNGSGSIGFDRGYGLSGALGLALGRFRIEAEAIYRWADLESVSVTTSGMQLGTQTLTTGLQAATGDVTVYGALANFYYDIYTGTGWVPYVGAGAGLANVGLKVDNVGATATGFDETDWVFAYQGSFGLAYQITAVTAFTMGYRYFATTEATFSVSGTDNDFDLSAHIFQLGLRYKF